MSTSSIFYKNLLLTILLVGSPAAAADTPKLATDKAAHFGLSSVAVEATMKSCQAWEGGKTLSAPCRYGSSALILAAGVLKELADKNRGNRFDTQDLAADVLGVVTGNILQWDF